VWACGHRAVAAPRTRPHRSVVAFSVRAGRAMHSASHYAGGLVRTVSCCVRDYVVFLFALGAPAFRLAGVGTLHCCAGCVALATIIATILFVQQACLQFSAASLGSAAVCVTVVRTRTGTVHAQPCSRFSRWQ
jgi:hypothetical protein